ncbi:NAD(P)-binding protein [Polyplosphaeria fusca]|uniref:NAD(P)-binding protein n=1 Tax=Polyplosphaeria fusca TaxID=682080 RepID=A0A9P4V149_9PLEO|nr:NAD(P)-binding protein [Polyplosphaeria fusca]
MSPPTVLITGVSSGIGLLFAVHALKQGATVIGTIRNPSRAADALSRLSSVSSKFHPVTLDVTHLDKIPLVIEGIKKKHGPIDTLINNAGYSIMGPVEEVSMEEAKYQLDTCYFGPLALMKAVLPDMRKRRSGTIMNLSSVAGINGLPGVGTYAASKFALEGTTESMAVELAPFNIRMILVEPGAFRTEFLTSTNLILPGGGREWIEDYQGDNPATLIINRMREYNGKQPGDPEKAAERMWEVISDTGYGEALKGKGIGKVLRVLLGSDSLGRMKTCLDMRQETLRDVEALAKSCDF